jgi:hypothetical protein
MDCNFNPQTKYKYKIKKDSEGNNSLGNIIWENDNETELEYNIRYLDPVGNIITVEEYLLDSDNNYIAAFVGCTYHCG